jgi:hypothetical protein
VSGNVNVVDTTEATAPAAAGSISSGKNAWVNGELVTGTLSGGYTCATGLLSPLGRWCDNGDGTVRDMTTGLLWLQDAGWGGMLPWWASTESGTSAFDKVSTVGNGNPATLTDGSTAGDWRLPTKSELVALATGTEFIRSTAMYKFKSINVFYLTSSSYDIGYNIQWYVKMDDGFVGLAPKVVSYGYVWPVRGGQ